MTRYSIKEFFIFLVFTLCCTNLFSEEIIGLDIIAEDKKYFKMIHTIDFLADEVKKSDIVIITVPLTELTRNLFDLNMINNMKQGSVLVNVSRGGIVDENALLHGLETRLLGAVLDVFENEPLPKDHKLWDKENLVIIPHSSFISENNEIRMWNTISTNLKKFISFEE